MEEAKAYALKNIKTPNKNKLTGHRDVRYKQDDRWHEENFTADDDAWYFYYGKLSELRREYEDQARRRAAFSRIREFIYEPKGDPDKLTWTVAYRHGDKWVEDTFLSAEVAASFYYGELRKIQEAINIVQAKGRSGK